MERLDRRTFLRQSAIAGGAVLGLEGLIARGALAAQMERAPKGAGGYGDLIPTASVNTGETLLALPEGFQYTVFGRTGDRMSDGRPTPGTHDGMAAFAGADGNIRLVRNHEQSGGAEMSRAYGDLPYDPKATGGTTTLVVDPTTRLLVEDFASLSGTVRNCAGGPTPWGTWITCEETTVGPAPDNFYTRAHGYNFDVPAFGGEAAPVALKDMGRFSHEAVAVDPATGTVYETEDTGSAGFYRFLPNVPGSLAAGGRLQMLAVKYRPNYDTRRDQRVGQRLLSTWVDIDNPDPALEQGAPSVAGQGFAKGAAAFARLEGAWYGSGSIFINSTSGGDIGRGQVWQYTPYGANEGYLTLLYESRDPNILDSPDNLCVSPRGGLVLCEDGSGEEFLHGLTLRGQIFKFAQNIVPGFEGSELAGATFSPDGQTLFFNIQSPGLTFAVWGPWEAGAL